MKTKSALLIGLLAACGGSAGSDPNEPCVPGQSRACSCDGEPGAEVCEPDGFGYGACSCDPGADDGSSGSDPSDPSGDPSDPSGDPSDPSGDPSDPTSDPSDPSGDPSDPTNDPTDPTGDTGAPENPSFAQDIVPILMISCGATDDGCHARNAYAANADFDCRGWLSFENTPLGSQIYAPPETAGTPTNCPDIPLYDRLFMVAWQCAPEQGEPGYQYVQPGDVANSFIFRKIDDDFSECGVPPDSTVMPPPGEPWALTALQRETLANWIESGALNN